MIRLLLGRVYWLRRQQLADATLRQNWLPLAWNKNNLEGAYSRLGETAFQEEQAVGQKLSLEDAVAYARDLLTNAGGVQQIRQQLDPLTPRECEVAALIAQAKSNAEIAAKLVVSKRTVETHIANTPGMPQDQ
jgi:DNA-binding CsgD family transcriptional regulator